jgi:peptidoglycan/LPS O-acetylase OafA/YrhL
MLAGNNFAILENSAQHSTAVPAGSFNPTMHGLRGLSALLVFVFHIFDMSRKLSALSLPAWVQGFLTALPAGVDIFFMISGYLITGSLIRHANVRAFFVDRVARIYPVFLFIHGILFLLAPVIGYKWTVGITPLAWIVHFFSNLLFLPGLLPLPLMQLNAWSLSYEAAFYLLSAAIYWLWDRARGLAYVILAGVVPLFLAIYPRTAFLLTGVAAYFLLNRKAPSHPLSIPGLGVPGFAGFLFVMSFALTSPHIYMVWLALPFGFCFFTDAVQQTPPISNLLQSGLMQFFGKISYGFYLWHPIVAFPLRSAMTRILMGKLGEPPVTAMLVFGVIAFALTVLVSWISWRILEEQGGRWVRSRFAGEQALVPAKANMNPKTRERKVLPIRIGERPARLDVIPIGGEPLSSPR